MATIKPPLSNESDLVKKFPKNRQTEISRRLGSSERSVRSAELDPATASLAAASFKYAEASGRAHAADERLRTISEKTTVHFPPEKELLACLSKHPLTNDPFFTEKKINATAAEFFANSDKYPNGIVIGVSILMDGIAQETSLPPKRAGMVGVNLATALTDCAQENHIQ